MSCLLTGRDMSPSPVSELAIVITTFAVGSDFKVAVKVAVPRPSVVTPDNAPTRTPAVSLSLFVTFTVPFASAL